MGAGIGSEGGLSPLFKALLLLEQLLLATLAKRLDLSDAVADRFADHLRIALMEEA